MAQTIREDSPQFRILVIGNTGVGKSSIIQNAFGIEEACCSDFVRGKAEIGVGLRSNINGRFILHDSLGFEPGYKGNLQIVKDFVQSRRTGPPNDRLHAIWFCLKIPRAGARLLESVVEDFFRKRKEIMGTIPLIVVYTLLDLAVDECTMELATARCDLDDESIIKLASSEGASSVYSCFQ
ncbi:hypothetical protein V8E55_002706 [Tylopilus felleus]